MKQIKKIVIIGGGTAGWATALNFLQKTVNVKIQVVAAEEIPIIGVGESTTGRFNGLINQQQRVLQSRNSFFRSIPANWHRRHKQDN
jgi:tryptophan 7-halogenase